MAMHGPGSPKQQRLVRNLVTARFNTINSEGTFENVEQVFDAMDVDNLSKQDISDLIGRLFKLPEDPDDKRPTTEGVTSITKGNSYENPCVTCGHMVPVNTGYYGKRHGSWVTMHPQGECDFTPVVGIDITGVPAGKYAVPEGDTRLKIQIDRPDRGNWAGWTFVKDAAEYGRGQMLGKVAPGAEYVGKGMEAVAAIVADPKAATAAYGQLTGNCGLCGRTLEDEESVARGIGPVCIKKL